MLRVEKLSKAFGAVEALKDVSFEAASGERLAVVGMSGSGKTTLLRLIAGLVCPDDGDVIIGERHASTAGRVLIEPRHRKLSMLFQDLALWPHLSVAEQLDLVLKPKGMSRKQRSERVDAMLETAKMTNRAGAYPSDLSGGGKQKAALLRALITEPELLLLDEPLAHIDVFAKEDLFEWMKGLLQTQKATCLYVTHECREAAEIGERIAILHEGTLQQIGDLTELREKPATDVVRAYTEHL
jgi:ABC-type sugar transport system ATPase subunit